MFFTTPVPMSPYSLNYYPHYHPGVSLAVSARASQYLAEQRERAWALRYQQQPMNQPTPIAHLAQEYDEFPDQQRMMDILSTCRPQDERKIGYIMALEHAAIQRDNYAARQAAELQRSTIQKWHFFVALQAHIEEEQGFARQRADAEKFLAEAETYLSGFLPPDQEPYYSTFRSFDLPDTPIPTSTEQPLLKNMIDDCIMTENRLMAEYKLEVRHTLQSILDCLSAAIERSSSMQVNDTEDGTSIFTGGKRKIKSKEIPGLDAEEPSAYAAQVISSFPKITSISSPQFPTELDSFFPHSDPITVSIDQPAHPIHINPSEDVSEVDLGAFFLCCEL